MDDEPAIRDLMARWVASLGLQPRTAGDAQTLMALVEERTPDVMRHSERVKAHVVAIARHLRVDGASLAVLEQAALFHDVGKVAVPAAVLTKPSALSPAEIAIPTPTTR